LNSRRFDGCTLTGALSVTTQITDGITIVHGPAGCAHHNFSLLHATMRENGECPIPAIRSTDLTEEQVIFGGESSLEAAIVDALRDDPAAVFVVSTCVAETIGDDAAAICARTRDVPILYIPTGGSRGGAFQQGFVNALVALSALGKPSNTREASVNLVGEKNLEYEVDENYAEIKRLLGLVGLPVGVRYVRHVGTEELARLGSGSLNVLREPGLAAAGHALEKRFGTGFISGFPVGLAGTLAFLREVGGDRCETTADAVKGERERQLAMLADFDDLTGERVRFGSLYPTGTVDPACQAVVHELAAHFALHPDTDGPVLPLPASAPVGTAAAGLIVAVAISVSPRRRPRSARRRTSRATRGRTRTACGCRRTRTRRRAAAP
jgi:nitrogenase molybdenum-iron protein alpha/beta subunit